MADQRIFFEQGSLTTGDSGERGDSTAAGGGALSVKPVVAGERAAEVVINRPTSNLRKRTEVLRTAGEQAKYLQDAGMGWILTAGNAAGLSPGPAAMPGISSWNPVAGTFIVNQPIVVQPINTPGSDKQETATYSFTDGLSQTAAIAFTPLSSSTPTVKQKRAYNGANLIRIVWEALTAEELAGATIAGYCNASLSGDPEHILTISIRDDDTTTMAMLTSAMLPLISATGEIADIGLGYVISGTVSTALEISEVAALDYRMKGTFEREVHYIPTTSFSTFFGSNSLADGDTLSIHFATYTTDADIADPLSGRRERVPSNNTGAYPNNTTVLASDLFITSNADDVYKIPLSIPLCKRIGDDLYWLDGTVVTGTQALLPVYFGENGATVDRSNMPALDTNVTGSWLFNDIISIGATRAVTTTNDYAIYARRYTTAAITSNLYGMYLDTRASHTVGAALTGIYNYVSNAAAVTASVFGAHTTVSISEDPGSAVIGYLSELHLSDTNGQTPSLAYSASFNVTATGAIADTKATSAGGVLAGAILHGGAFTNFTGFEFSVPVSAGVDASTISYLRGFYAKIEVPVLTVPSNLVGTDIDIDVPTGGSVGTILKGHNVEILTAGTVPEITGYYSNILVGVGSTVSGDVFGEYSKVDHLVAVTNVYGRYLDVRRSAAIPTPPGTGVTYGDYITVTVTKDPGDDVAASASVLNLNNTGTEQPDTAFAYRGILNSSGATADTKAALAGGMYVSGVLDGGAFPEFAGARVELPGGAAATAATVTDYIGLKSTVTTRTNVTTTNAYGALVHLDCSAAGPSGDSIGLKVTSTDAEYGLSVVATDAGSSKASLYVNKAGTTGYGLYSAANRDYLDGALTVGFGAHGSLPSGEVALNIQGAFQTRTAHVDVDDITSPTTATLDVENVSLLELYWKTTNTINVETFSNGVDGQWLIVVNNTGNADGTDSVTVEFNEDDNIEIAGATDTLINRGESIMFVYIERYSKWREVYRLAP